MRTLHRRGMSSRSLRVDRSNLLVVTAVACQSIRSPSPRRRCLASSGGGVAMVGKVMEGANWAMIRAWIFFLLLLLFVCGSVSL
ncbi:unnamed protein product [Linum trigynum]|uniref:Uncharacterized protein n=1 Tax=Linum trigynum TaxID=586398 RepID=A0AAV2GG89_9ROSI